MLASRTGKNIIGIKNGAHPVSIIKGKETLRRVSDRSNWPVPHISGVKAAAPATSGALVNEAFEEAGSARPLSSKRRKRGGAEGERQGPESGAMDSTRFYLNGIRKYPLLTQKEEKELARRISKGDKTARKRMIESNLRLVVSIAKRYPNRGLCFQDLIEEGNVGLIKAVERFRPSKGCRFSTYATYWIKQSVERAMANQAETVRLPVHVGIDLSKISKATRELTLAFNRQPTIDELSAKTGLSGRYVKKLSTIRSKSCSLDTALTDGSEQTLLEQLEDASLPTPMEMIDSVRRLAGVEKLLGMLDDNERVMLRLRFGFEQDEPHTLERIGKRFGVTRERARQIEVKALAKLRKIIGENGKDALAV